MDEEFEVLPEMRAAREELGKLRGLRDENQGSGVITVSQVPDARDAFDVDILRELSLAKEEVMRIKNAGGSAKEMASALRYASLLTLMRGMAGEDLRLASDSAKTLLDRSDGKAGGGVEEKPSVSVNILNTLSSESGKADFFKKLRFLGKRAGDVIDIDV